MKRFEYIDIADDYCCLSASVYLRVGTRLNDILDQAFHLIWRKPEVNPASIAAPALRSKWYHDLILGIDIELLEEEGTQMIFLGFRTHEHGGAKESWELSTGGLTRAP